MSANYVKYNPRTKHFTNADVAFKIELQEYWPKLIALELHDLAKDMARYALKRVLELQPVETGETLSLWTVTLNQRGNEQVRATVKYKNDSHNKYLRRLESSTYQRGLGVINSSKPGDVIIIQNNSVVAQIIEFGLFDPPDPGPSKQRGYEGMIRVEGGYSTQAPQGVVYVVQAELNEIFK